MDEAERTVDFADALMREYAERTGLTSDRPPVRYLWTDAHAVCNFITLARHCSASRLELAVRLTDDVHRVLGRHRDDDPRTGWISGLGEEQGKAHPTRGGLRIGKPLPERGASEPMDPRLEWERDGQYFHYLTKWMHALDQLARASGQARYNGWARELAAAAFDAFLHTSGRRRHMYWKMSVDLSRPLVPSMGQHDPVDGFVTCRQLDATAAGFGQDQAGPALAERADELESLARGVELETTDPLGIGGLLVDASRLVQTGGAPVERWVDALLSVAAAGLEYFVDELERPAEARLAFRELGLAIGLKAIEALRGAQADEPADSGWARSKPGQLRAVQPYVPLAGHIAAFWREHAARPSSSWRAHRDINEVMLAGALAPEGLVLLHGVPLASPSL